MTEDKSDFRGVNLQRGLTDEIDELVGPQKKYHSRAEFVSEACRIRLEQVKAAARSA